jgi:hypothetical protein
VVDGALNYAEFAKDLSCLGVALDDFLRMKNSGGENEK